MSLGDSNLVVKSFVKGLEKDVCFAHTHTLNIGVIHLAWQEMFQLLELAFLKYRIIWI